MTRSSSNHLRALTFAAVVALATTLGAGTALAAAPSQAAMTDATALAPMTPAGSQPMERMCAEIWCM